MPSAVANALFWLAVACCAVAQAAIFRSTIAARRRSPSARADEASAERRSGAAAELAWAVLPALALVAILVLTWRTMHSVAHGSPGTRGARGTAVSAPPATFKVPRAVA